MVSNLIQVVFLTCIMHLHSFYAHRVWISESIHLPFVGFLTERLRISQWTECTCNLVDRK